MVGSEKLKGGCAFGQVSGTAHKSCETTLYTQRELIIVQPILRLHVRKHLNEILRENVFIRLEHIICLNGKLLQGDVGEFLWIRGQKVVECDVYEGAAIKSVIWPEYGLGISDRRVLVREPIDGPMKVYTFLDGDWECIFFSAFDEITDHVSCEDVWMSERQVGMSQIIHGSKIRGMMAGKMPSIFNGTG